MSENAIESINAAIESAIPVLHGMGVRAVDAEPGSAATTVPIEGNGNHFGAMYAGVLFSVAEVLGGVLAASTFDPSKYYPLVKDVQIAFRRPATTDVRAEARLDDEIVRRATADAEANGKAEFVLEAVVTDAHGVTVATTRGVYQLRALRAPGDGHSRT